MKQADKLYYTNTHEQHASSNRPIKINFVRMKIILFYAFLVVLFTSLDSQAQNRTITVYQQGGAIVFDEYNEKIPKGISTLSYSNLVSGYSSNSFFVFADESVAQFQFKKGASFSDFVLSYKGKKISISEHDGERFSGILLDYAFNAFFIQLSDGSTIYLPSSKVGTIQFPSMNSGFNESDVVEVVLSTSTSTTKKVVLQYQSPSVKWEPAYSLILSENEKSASFHAIAKLSYTGEQPISNANLRLNYGNLSQHTPAYPAPRPLYRSDVKMKTEALSFNESIIETSTESIGDNYEIVLDKPISIQKNATQHIILTDVTSIPITKKYAAQLTGYTREKAFPQVSFEFEYSEKLGFKHPAAAGNVNLFIKKNKELRNLAQARIPNTSLSSTVKLSIGESFEIPIKEIMTQSEQVSQKVSTASFSISVTNNKKEPVTVNLSRYLDSYTSITESSKKYTREKSDSIVFKVELKPGKTEEFTFSTRTEYK